MELPNEILSEIMSYVCSDPFAISLTCKRLHAVSCNTNLLKLRLSKKLLDDDKSFNSVINSNRRFHSLVIFQIEKRDRVKLTETRRIRLKQIFQRFGQDVKSVELNNFKLPSNIIELLNLMPNLKIILLERIRRNPNETIIERKMELKKLEKIFCKLIDEEAIRIFDQLTPGVLKEIRISEIKYENDDDDNESVNRHFPNQNNVKRIMTDENCFDWSKMKLKSLEIKYIFDMNAESVKKMLKGQDEMETFKSKYSFKGKNILKVICDELKSLRELKVVSYQVDENENPELWKLCKLKILKLCYLYGDSAVDVEKFLRSIRSVSVENLRVNCNDDSIFSQNICPMTHFQKNFPRLRKLEIVC
jgi:F-box-like